MTKFLHTPEGEVSDTFVPMYILGNVKREAGAEIPVSKHTRLNGINPDGPCESDLGIVAYEYHGTVRDDGGVTIPKSILVVKCSSDNCDAKAFPRV